MAFVNILQIIYPVGSIYTSTNSTSPATLIGGTWTALTDGKFLRPSGSWNQTGGEETHTITVSEMPSHSHQVWSGYTNPTLTSALDALVYQAKLQNASYHMKGNGASNFIEASGNSKAHNNLPPYRTCYMWYRTA